ncbi:ankyrin repeat domain-containing protein [Azospirillum sp. ST 5-10]|uniref:ankyrin repeat domain-containing protein n=1 Tax=unclassified Azospirillum TaxID=2630922 RepID=UPI003F49DBFD
MSDASDAAPPVPHAGTPEQREALEGLKLALLARKRLLVLAGGGGGERGDVFARLTAEVAADGALVLVVAARAGMDVEALVAAAGRDAAGRASDDADFDGLIDELERRLDLAGCGLLAVNDAQHLAPETLADLADLSGSESPQGRFLQVLLCGPAALERALTPPPLARALRDHGVIYRLAGPGAPSAAPAAEAPGPRLAAPPRGAVAPPGDHRPRRALPWAAVVVVVLGLGAAVAVAVPDLGDRARLAGTYAAGAWHGARAFLLNERRPAAEAHAALSGAPASTAGASAEPEPAAPAPAIDTPIPAIDATADAVTESTEPVPPEVPAAAAEPFPPDPVAVASLPDAAPAAGAEPAAGAAPDGAAADGAAPDNGAQPAPPAEPRPDSLARLLNDLEGMVLPEDEPEPPAQAVAPADPAPLPPLAPPTEVAALPSPPPPPVDPDLQRRVEALAERARGQLADKKLTTPEGDNAFETVQRMQALLPEAPAAGTLLDEMEDTYRRWAAMAKTKGDWLNARLFYQRALIIDPDDPELQNLLGEAQAQAQTGSTTVSSAPEAATLAILRDPAGLEAALAGGVLDANARLPGGKTPLMVAAEQGLLDQVRSLLRRGANPRARTETGATPLMYAAYGGHAGLVDLLAAAGADVDAANVDGKTALMAAAARGNAAVVRTLLARGAAVDRPTRHGWTALMYAANGGHDAAARLLMAGGADPGRTDAIGNSAVSLGRDHGHYQIVQVLTGR